MLASMKARAVRLSVAWILALATGLPFVHEAGASVDARSMLADAYPGQVDRDHEDDEDRGQDRARRAHAAGEILPIAEIYRRARQETRGRVLEADLERAHGRWVYTLTIMDPQGGVFDLDFDGATGQSMGREED
jgi:uncharacterized membrane protein YkoI